MGVERVSSQIKSRDHGCSPVSIVKKIHATPSAYKPSSQKCEQVVIPIVAWVMQNSSQVVTFSNCKKHEPTCMNITPTHC